MGFLGGLDGKESTCNAGDPDLIPGLGRSLGKGNDNPLQYSCLENSIDRGAWWPTIHGVTNKTNEQIKRKKLFLTVKWQQIKENRMMKMENGV